jgi:hypothetical protein
VTDEASEANAQNAPGPNSARRGPSRRTFLVGGGVAVLAGAGGGVGAAFAQSKPRPPVPPPPPADLLAALAAERTLIASVAAALSARPASRAVLAQIHADHEAHARALEAAIAPTTVRPDPAASPLPSSSPPPPVPGTAALRAAETAAAHTAASRAAASTGRNATLLASISACEATHAELLT